MAYHLWDGFDDYNSATELWSSAANVLGYSSSYARFPAPSGLVGQGMKMVSSPGSSKTWNMITNQATMIFGFAIYVPTLASAGSGSRIMQFSDSGTVQCSLCISSSGEIVLIKSFGGSVLAISAPGVFTSGAWHWLDVVVTISNGAGSITVYIDQPKGGPAILSATGLVTQQSSHAYMNQFLIGDFGAVFGGIQFDDFHAHDNTGSAPNAVLGDSRIYTKVPSGAGYSTQWTPNGASANWQCVDDSPPDGDTTYVASNTPGQTDGYAVPAAGFTDAPNGIVRRSYVRKDDASIHTFQNGVRSGSTNALGTAQSVTSSYEWLDGETCYVNDPSTSSPWTAAAADAATPVIVETS